MLSDPPDISLLQIFGILDPPRLLEKICISIANAPHIIDGDSFKQRINFLLGETGQIKHPFLLSVLVLAMPTETGIPVYRNTVAFTSRPKRVRSALSRLLKSKKASSME